MVIKKILTYLEEELPTRAALLLPDSRVPPQSSLFGLAVTVEGVETEKQWKQLREWRCDELQGYLFSKPLPVEPFTQLLCQRYKEASLVG